MAEEKKEEKIEAKAEEVKPKADAAEPKTEPAKAEAPAAAAPAAPEKVKPANCASCNKSIKGKRWYYRNGKFYCTKRCWKTAQKKEAKPEEAKA